MAARRPPSPDIIAAVATAPGRGGIGVVRVSGPQLTEYTTRLLGRLPIPRQASFSNFRDAAGQCIDEGLALWFPAPHSFTGEDVLELQGHGGPQVMRLLLSACLDAGARLAEPGEFTRRAYLNGKLDLAQAEAVADLIDASSEQAARSAVRSLAGEFSREIHGLVDELTELRALTEATLDFPEEVIDFLKAADAFGRLARLHGRLAAVTARAQQGRLLQNGLNVVLAGQPNVGKSSLLNCLAGDDLAIVTPIAGTTRDALRGSIQIEGIPLHIIDTAGLRETGDVVEQMGIERTWREIDKADVVVLLVDARLGVGDADHEILARLPQKTAHMPAHIVVHNKTDLAEISPRLEKSPDGMTHVWLSAKSGQGMDLLHSELLAIAGWQPAEDVFIARERHLRALAAGAVHITAAEAALPALELFAEELRLAQIALSETTGEVSSDDLLGEIFSRFCIGK